MELKEMLEKLCNATGVSGAENGACEVACELLKNYTDDAVCDNFGSVKGFIGDRNNGKPTVMLEAHIDEIGFIVTYIDDDGFIKVSNCGRTDRRLYAAQTVTIHTENGAVKGVIATLPPHVNPDTKTAMKDEDVTIDTGYTKAEVEKLVSLGDRVTIDAKFTPLLGTRVTGKATDDRSGVAAVLYALELMKSKTLMYNVEVLFAAQEEVGCRGALINSYNSEARYAIATDVSFAYTSEAKREKCGDMGKGAMIGIAPILDKELTNELKALAKSKDIPHQFEIMSGETGTDADEISKIKGGIRTALLSIPQKYMHTPIEVVDLKDIESVSRIMAEFVTGGAENV